MAHLQLEGPQSGDGLPAGNHMSSPHELSSLNRLDGHLPHMVVRFQQGKNESRKAF